MRSPNRDTARNAGFALLAVLVLAARACGPETAPPETGGPETARPSPVPAIDFDLELLGGGRARLAQYRGQLLLLDFWATWCPPCVTEIPELNAFYDSQRKRGVELLAISVDDLESGEIADWVEAQGVRYPVALGSEELARQYGAHAYPFHVVIGADGNVLEIIEPGFHEERELIAILDAHRSG